MRMVFILLVLCFLCTMAQAEALNISGFIDDIKFDSGISYDITNGEVVNTETFKVFEYTKWKIKPAINAGYATNDKLIVGISCNLLNVGDYIKFPIVDLLKIDPIVAYSFGHLNLQDPAGSKNSVLLGVKLIEVAF